VRFQKCVFEMPLSFDLNGVIFEKAERVTFHTVTLYPSWFINVDPRKFNFTYVRWKELSLEAIRTELKSLRGRGFANPHHLLALAYRQLAVNAEENNRYGEASGFRYAAMRTRSLEIRQSFINLLLSSNRSRRLRALRLGRRIKKLHIRLFTRVRLNQTATNWVKPLRGATRILDLMHSLYGFSSGYGERAGRATLVLVGVWLVFAGVYWSGDSTWWETKASKFSIVEPIAEQPPLSPTSPLGFRDALIYSAGVMTLQKPEPLPANQRCRVVVLLETIIGPLQGALLALAIRRKFMR
jgi:hypothetical protein